MVKAEHRRQVLSTMWAPKNFFKHANKDPEAILEFNPETTGFFVVGAIADFEIAAQRGFHAGEVFKLWFFLKRLDMLDDGEPTRPLRDALDRARRNGTTAENKTAFLELLAAQ